MSTTTTKRTWREARRDAEAFRDMFSPDDYDAWVIAGSVRREASSVGDVEHVIRPLVGPIAGAGLFAEPGNLVFARLDALVADGTLTKHLYGASGFRWGEKCRGVDFRGHLHELYCADDTNFGATLAIRTGPAEFSKRLVTGLLKHDRRNKDGKVWRCDRCVCEGQDKLCHNCEGYGLVPVEQLSVPDERQYFDLCGIVWTEPKDRFITSVPTTTAGATR